MKAILLVLTIFATSITDDPRDELGGPEPLAGSGPKYYEMVDEVSLKESVNHNGTGFFIEVVPIDGTSNDTLEVYIQGVIKGKVPPDYARASGADLVIWCYPQTYPHPKHVFPESSGRVYMKMINDSQFAVITEKYKSLVESLSSD